MPRHRRSQSGQVMVLVAVSLIALIGSAALVLLAGSAEWQKNQLQQVADQAALEAALKITIGCDAGRAATVINTAETSIGKQRTPVGGLGPVLGGPCAAGYTATETYSAGALSATINYPYRAHQQQVEVILTLTLPISFGGVVGSTGTTLVRRAVAQALPGSVPTLSATTLSCTGGQVNVAGSVVAQNAIALSNNCALYSHARIDASGTYSDLGNTSVYADGQTWVGGGGSCAALSNAICADGSELTGHVTPTCGTTSAFLSVGDAAINPNPCAAGVARPPVPLPSTALPPEPNTDPTSIAQLIGTGGACSSAGTFPKITVNGTTVGYGDSAPTLVNGFYHFKPSCYGYLNIGPLSAGISKVQVGPIVTGKNKITPTFVPGPTTAGTLLVAMIRSDSTPTKFDPPAGWVEAGVPSQAGASPRTEIWYYENNPVWVGPITFQVTPGNIDATAQLSEWSNVATVNPVDTTGNFSAGANQLTATIATGGATTAANDLVITNDGIVEGQAGQAISNPAGWNSLANDPTDGFTSEYRLDLPAAVASEKETASVATNWAIVIAAFKPKGGGSGAVFDPGFYYFNGYDGAAFTNGGICLNGGTLLAQDTTLEFVNKASFTSGDCTAGGGADCTAPCQFGSTPCSISACPPNAPLSSSSLTWFAAPCSQAPAGDSSCPGPGWCTNGDRACMNVLIWSSSTGQIAIKGANAQHWLLGSIYWPGACTDTVNGTSTIAGTLSCGSLSISAGAGAGTAVGGDYGIATSLVEANLVE
jgi:Putative Flp pilus-assembly TadE/G-like